MSKGKKGKQETKVEEIEPEVEEEKPFTFLDIEFEGFRHIFNQEDIDSFAIQGNMKQSFLDYLGQWYMKERKGEKAEYNELNIISDFHLYNLSFARDELYLPPDKSALLLNILWSLLGFKDGEESVVIKQGVNNINTPEQNIDEDNQDYENPAQSFNAQLEQKWKFFKELMLTFSLEMHPHKIKVFSSDEVEKILKYVRETYFRHFRLYSYVLSTQQLCETKKITVYVDKPLEIPPLSEALSLGKEKLEYEDEDEEKGMEEDEVRGSMKSSVKEMSVPGDEGRESVRSSQVVEDDSPEGMIKKLNIDENSKKVLQSKLDEFKSQMEAKLEERQKILDDKVAESKAPKKKRQQSDI